MASDLASHAPGAKDLAAVPASTFDPELSHNCTQAAHACAPCTYEAQFRNTLDPSFLLHCCFFGHPSHFVATLTA